MGWLTIALASHALAQGGSAEFPSVGSSSLVIANTASQTLQFSVRPERGNWGNYVLEPGANMTISCDGCTASFFEFTMNTENRSVTYDLDPARRYVLQWSAQKNLWDILATR